MKKEKTIGLITEGLDFSTPNGILTWVSTLVNSLPQFNFVIINLVNKKKRNNTPTFLPSNVIKVLNIPIWEESERASSSNSEFDEVDLSVSRIKKNRTCQRYLIANARYNKELFGNAIDRILSNKYPKVDLYHSANAGLAGVLGAFLKEETKTKLIVSEHGSYYKEWLMRLYDNFFPSEIKFPKELSRIKLEIVPTIKTVRNISSFVFEHADLILPVTKTHIPIEMNLGAPQNKIKIMYNGKILPESNYIPEEHIFEGDAIKIGTLGRINPIKGLETLIATASELTKESNKYEFHIYGPIDDYDYYIKCKEKLEASDIEDKVIFHNFNWDPQIALEQMDIFTLFSRSEGLPFALIEAAGFGLPTIASNVGGVKEILDGFGITINKFNNSRVWKNAIIKITENKRKTILRIKKQKNYINRNFNIFTFQKNMENTYKLLLS